MNPATYVALLRGINVGGHTVKMDVLRGLFADLRLSDVRTYIQSGNVFFTSDEPDRGALRATIETRLRDSLGFDVPVCLRTVAELQQVLARDPFSAVELTPDIRLSVTFFREPVSETLPLPYHTPDGAYEVVSMTPTELFVVWHLRDRRPGSSFGLIEKRFPGHATTTRFWHTLARILAAASNARP